MKKIYIISCMLFLSCVAFGQQFPESSKPLFDGDQGNEKLNRYIYSQIGAEEDILSQIRKEEFLNDSIVGIVVIRFAIDVDGSVVDTEIFHKAHPILDKEVLRVFNSMPKWTPSFNQEKPVKMQMAHPVIFAPVKKPDND